MRGTIRNFENKSNLKRQDTLTLEIIIKKNRWRRIGEFNKHMDEIAVRYLVYGERAVVPKVGKTME